MRLKLVQAARMALLVVGIAASVAFSQKPEGGFGRDSGNRGGEEGGRGLGKGGFTFGDPEAMAKNRFEQMDTNKDGKLSKEEVEAKGSFMGRRSGLLEDWAKYDKNRDGAIELSEYRDYITARMSGGFGGMRREERKEERPASTEAKRSAFVAPGVREIPQGLDARPTVYRYGKLPTKELPTWFIDLDTDKDGQVGLYEWRAGKRPSAEFKEYDLNGDGFITPEEMLSSQKRKDEMSEAGTATYLRVNAAPGSSDAPPATPSASKSESSSSGGDRGRGWGRGKGRFGSGEEGEGRTKGKGKRRGFGW